MTLAPQGAAWQLSLHVREREREGAAITDNRMCSRNTEGKAGFY